MSGLTWSSKQSSVAEASVCSRCATTTSVIFSARFSCIHWSRMSVTSPADIPAQLDRWVFDRLFRVPNSQFIYPHPLLLLLLHGRRRMQLWVSEAWTTDDTLRQLDSNIQLLTQPSTHEPTSSHATRPPIRLPRSRPCNCFYPLPYDMRAHNSNAANSDPSFCLSHSLDGSTVCPRRAAIAAHHTMSRTRTISMTAQYQA